MKEKTPLRKWVEKQQSEGKLEGGQFMSLSEFSEINTGFKDALKKIQNCLDEMNAEKEIKQSFGECFILENLIPPENEWDWNEPILVSSLMMLSIYCEKIYGKDTDLDIINRDICYITKDSKRIAKITACIGHVVINK